jgi:hypothetical protein
MTVERRPKPQPHYSPYGSAPRSQPDLVRRPTNSSAKVGIYICCRCRDGPKVREHQRRCISCNHIACSSCTWDKGSNAFSGPEVASRISRSSRYKSSKVSDTAAPTSRKKNGQMTHPKDDHEVKSDTLPLQQPAGAADAILVYPQTSEDVVQISSSCGEEALPNVRGDSSPTANTAMLPEEDPVSRLDVLEIGLRYFT